MTSKPQVFVDTSTLIALTAYLDIIREKLHLYMQRFGERVSCDVVLFEYKRRVLVEAVYCIDLLRKYGAVSDALAHANTVLTNWQNRKKNISIILLSNLVKILPKHNSEAEAIEEAILTLETLVEVGSDMAAMNLDRVDRSIGCANGDIEFEYDRRQKKMRLKYRTCEEAATDCQLCTFLRATTKVSGDIAKAIAQVPAKDKTEELGAGEKFAKAVAEDPDSGGEWNACNAVGDTVIALCAHSLGIEHFLTKNYKESVALWKHMGKHLHIFHNSPEKDVEEV